MKHKLLSADEIPAYSNLIQPQPNEHAYFEPKGGLLRPERCISVQLNLAKQGGATVHTDERVISYDITDDQVMVQTEQREYIADKLVLSAGAWMVDLMPDDNKKNLKFIGR